jgi:hypothetical protein
MSTPSERVLALLYRYEYLDCREQYSKKEVLEALLWAANVASEDGEQHLAPAWLQALRQQKGLYEYRPPEETVTEASGAAQGRAEEP